ncbi:hypothetical protein ABT186_01995 [Streptomyces sp. NPDC001634]|uniref:hypothetical protein n=1 Tax=Streptomyces sp. NPDC001634 TaxID=3154390 RepID=UPI00333255D3
MPNPEFEREVAYIGGPWDGQTRWEPKAFWPPSNQMPSGERGLTGAWPDAWPADEPRYMPEIVQGENGCQVRYVWAAPDDQHAPALIPRPESIKDYSDYDDYDEEPW